MIINRVWAMPNRWTFTILPIKKRLTQIVQNREIWIDPFAGKHGHEFATVTNDINPNMSTDFHKDALEFLKSLPTNLSVDRNVLYDPPYSFAEFKKCYEDIGLKADRRIFTKQYEMLCKNEIARLVPSGGIVCSFGWNSNGMGINRGFKLIEILLVAHGGSRNDTIMTVELKR